LENEPTVSFFPLFNYIVDHQFLTEQEKLLMLAILRSRNQRTLQCNPSQSSLALRTRKSRWHVNHLMKILEQKKLLHYRVNTPNTHGTGCSLSSAIATYLADGHDLSHAVAKGIAYVEAGLEAGVYLSIGEGSGPLWHMHAFYPTALPDDIESSTP
jgi:hypothetical protein